MTPKDDIGQAVRKALRIDRAVRLVFRTANTDPEFVTAQALTIQTHCFTGLTLTLALLYAALWRG